MADTITRTYGNVIDRETERWIPALTSAAADLVERASKIAERMMFARLAGSVNRADIEDALLWATAETVAYAVDRPGQTLERAAAVVCGRIAKDVARSVYERHARMVSTDSDVLRDMIETDYAERTYSARYPAPDRIAHTSPRDVVAEAYARVADASPELADMITVISRIPGEDGRAWRNGMPSAKTVAAMMGHPDASGRMRGQISRLIHSAMEALTDAVRTVEAEWCAEAGLGKVNIMPEGWTNPVEYLTADADYGKINSVANGKRIDPLPGGKRDVITAMIMTAEPMPARGMPGVKPGAVFGNTRAGFNAATSAKGRHAAGCGTHFLTESAARDHDAKCDGMHGRFTVATGDEASEN